MPSGFIECPQCKASDKEGEAKPHRMPLIEAGSKATAAQCQECGYVEERADQAKPMPARMEAARLAALAAQQKKT